MGKRKAHDATYDDLLKLPDHVVGEIMDGELFVSPRPASPHARAASVLGSDLLGPFDRSPGGPGGPGGWWILDEPELHFRRDVLVPDLAGWRRERMPRMPSTPAFELAPDWVCEVVSPHTAKFDRTRKKRIYARERVLWMWLVDPLARTVEVFRLDDNHWVNLANVGEDETATVRLPPFEEIELEPMRWWLPVEEPGA